MEPIDATSTVWGDACLNRSYRPLPKFPVARALGLSTFEFKFVFSRKQSKSAGARRLWKGSIPVVRLY
jgi:hypothetical protein